MFQRETFKFDKNFVEELYLRSTELNFSIYGQHNWVCKRDPWFLAKVIGQEKLITPKTDGLTDFYPKEKYFRAKYVKEIEVLGQIKLVEREQETEIWGFANSKENAEKVVKHYIRAINNSVYFHFELDTRQETQLNKSSKKSIGKDEVFVAFKTTVLSVDVVESIMGMRDKLGVVVTGCTLAQLRAET